MVLLAFLIFSYSITAETKKLLILGDSISAGYGIKESQNWVHLFNNSTDAKKMNLYMINSSVSGDTTIGGLSRISKDLKQYNPDYVLIELGGNDALRGYPLKKIKNNLIKIIDASLKAKAVPLIMQIKIPPNYGQRYVEVFENIYVEISNEKNIPLLTFLLENVALDQSLMQLDGIHPNEKAQPIIVEQIKMELSKIIK
ncbi:MAG: arylesterase [SAR86 cluster bacterium]|uniref:Arylesterase n=1 Tax=SAR86 cluster bacterium TaxID=2030880 RepID=A0A937LCH8_9GAMM|nr:arylesterase [SAR86 cluster bacterium]